MRSEKRAALQARIEELAPVVAKRKKENEAAIQRLEGKGWGQTFFSMDPDEIRLRELQRELDGLNSLSASTAIHRGSCSH